MDGATIFYTYIAACIATNLSYMINDNNNEGKHHKDINQLQVQSPIEVTHIYIYTLPHRRVSSLHQIKIKRIMHSIEHMIELHSHIITSAFFPSFWNVFRRKMEKNIIIITSKHVEEFLFFTPRNHFLSIFLGTCILLYYFLGERGLGELQAHYKSVLGCDFLAGSSRMFFLLYCAFEYSIRANYLISHSKGHVQINHCAPPHTPSQAPPPGAALGPSM